jgi:drug/metabolite transporter (DMT)-like permease
MKNKKALAYLGLIFVIFLWGGSPLITLYFYKFYSPTVRVAFGSLTSGLAMLLIAGKRIRLLGRRYFGLAIPTGVCLGLADISQKIGLQYTTPTNYAFLENLSVVTVPHVLFLLIRKKPAPLTLVAVVLCLTSSLVLTGVLTEGGGFGKGDILCAISGMLYGVNIAITGRYAKGVCVPLYLSIQLLTVSVLGAASTALLSALEIEPYLFTFRLGTILLLVLFVLVSSTLGWLIRTAAMKEVDPTVVAVMMPFSSVVTVLVSVLLGKDTVTPSLAIGAVLGLAAIVISGLAEREKTDKTAKDSEADEH